MTAVAGQRADPRSRFVRLTSPVRNRRGGFSPLKAGVFACLFLPGIWLAARYFTGDLGARPVLALVHGVGLWTLRLLMIALALSPARVLLDWPQAGQIRRMVGVAAAVYAAIHLSLYTAQQNFHLGHVVGEILHRFYLTIGFIVLLALLALAATSTDRTMRRLGRNWKRLHRLAYPAAALGLLHYFLQAKANVSDAVILAGLFVWLMLWRALPTRWRVTPWSAALLGLAAVLGAIAIETAWYGIATGVHVRRVFAANFRFAHWRPSAYVAFYAAMALALVLTTRLARRRPETPEGSAPL